MYRRSIVPVLALILPVPACFSVAGDDHAAPQDARPDMPLDAPFGCTSPAQLAQVEVTVNGTVIDLATGAPIANATVDIAPAWTAKGQFPDPRCPPLATAVTGPDGTFGPLTFHDGPKNTASKIIAFVVHADGRAPTISDNRLACPTSDHCQVTDHVIPVPTAALDTAWRADLASGGVASAGTGGIVLFAYREADSSPAAGVRVALEMYGSNPLPPLPRPRYVAADRTTLAPASATATTGSGLVVVSRLQSATATLALGGERGTDHWSYLGCIVEDGWWFVEDERPPPPQ